MGVKESDGRKGVFPANFTKPLPTWQGFPAETIYEFFPNWTVARTLGYFRLFVRNLMVRPVNYSSAYIQFFYHSLGSCFQSSPAWYTSPFFGFNVLISFKFLQDVSVCDSSRTRYIHFSDLFSLTFTFWTSGRFSYQMQIFILYTCNVFACRSKIASFPSLARIHFVVLLFILDRK